MEVWWNALSQSFDIQAKTLLRLLQRHKVTFIYICSLSPRCASVSIALELSEDKMPLLCIEISGYSRAWSASWIFTIMMLRVACQQSFKCYLSITSFVQQKFTAEAFKF